MLPPPAVSPGNNTAIFLLSPILIVSLFSSLSSDVYSLYPCKVKLKLDKFDEYSNSFNVPWPFAPELKGFPSYVKRVFDPLKEILYLVIVFKYMLILCEYVTSLTVYFPSSPIISPLDSSVTRAIS